MMGCGEICATQNYLWCTADVLGNGVTGAVYKARNKKTGDMFAVKTFSSLTPNRAFPLQKKEFDLLRRLNHTNIVKLLTIENEINSNKYVLVMELCTGGSLYTMLDQPENCLGLPEEEFFTVLHDVAEGMRHLRDQRIIHRDIKPGNIMRFICEDNTSVYKLIDFGAARELQDEEQFMSLYGTEEYLCPDMYERAVLNVNSHKRFGVECDLWSMGVTLYHVATGQLPFRPYEGIRRNRELMYHLTSKKESGVISGVQTTAEGHIEWSRELPAHCRLSRGARVLVTPLLQGLMENDPVKMLTFDRFFSEVYKTHMKHCVHFTSLDSCRPLRIYIDPNQKLAQLQEHLTQQTNLHASKQYLLFDHTCLTQMVSANQDVCDYPPTSLQNTIYIFPVQEVSATIAEPKLPAFSAMSDNNVDTDADAAKRNCGLVFLTLHHVQEVNTLQRALNQAIRQYLLLFTRDAEHIAYYVSQFEGLCIEMEKRLHLFVKSSDSQSRLLALLNDDSQADGLMGNVRNELEQLRDAVHNELLPETNNLVKEVKKMKEDITAYATHCQERPERFHESPGLTLSQKCVNMMSHVKDEMESLTIIMRSKKNRPLNFSEQRLHQFDKLKMETLCKRCLQIKGQSYTYLNDSFEKFKTWYRSANNKRLRLHCVEKKVFGQMEQQTELSTLLSEKCRSVDEKLQRCLRELGDSGRSFDSRSTMTAGGDLLLRQQLISQLKIGLTELCEETVMVRNGVQQGADLMKRLESVSFSMMTEGRAIDAHAN